MSNKYDDIINLPHHQSTKHPRMSIYNRAAQFAPFAALTGHNAAIYETARITDEKIELDEYEKAEIDRKLQVISDNISGRPEITVTYFVPDSKKSGGAYKTYIGNVRRIDDVGQVLIMVDESVISINDIIDIKSEFINLDYEYMGK